ncbi:MAG: TPM domain-containing protein [Sarcina sp.]|nr:TPM domain-containing protein [Sarcina sp.]
MIMTRFQNGNGPAGSTFTLKESPERGRRSKKRIVLILLALLVFCAAALSPVSLMAAQASKRLVVEDGADLLTDEEEAWLIEDYSAITEYMDAAFVTTEHSAGSTSAFAEQYAIRHYGNDPAVIFVIDMENRELYIYANGPALKTISRADARAITDNIYKIASRGDYYECADLALSQILSKCSGGRLARPVKHATNALIAVLAGILLNYFITVSSRRPRVERRTKGSVDVSVSRQMATMPGISLALPIVLSSVRHYKSSSSGGSGGGGGGHSGGGGGHSF